MLDQTMIDRYIEDVDSYLHLDRAHRQRVLGEIEGHLHDAVESHIAEGIQPQEAIRRAIAAVGPPQDVAMQFLPTPVPARSVRGWRRWTPIVLPAVLLAVALVFCVLNLLLLRHGATYGVQIVLWHSFRYTAVVGALTGATYAAIQRGDRGRTWRRAAWAFAALTGVIVAMSTAA